MTRRVLSVVALLTLALGLPMSAASADPIVVIAAGSSVVTQDTFTTFAHLHGTHQFFADPLVFLSEISVCRPCGAPGEMVDMSATLNNTEFESLGTLEVAGGSYEVGQFFGAPNSASVLFRFIADPVVLPPSTSASAVVTTRFKLSGGLQVIPPPPGSPGSSSFTLSGQGTATFGIIRNPLEHDLWEFGSLRYDFTPTPEPATLTLMSGALVAAAIRSRKRRDRRTTLQLATSRSTAKQPSWSFFNNTDRSRRSNP